MKKNIFAFLSVGCLFLTTSCVDLTQEPQSFLTEEEYIQHPQSLETVSKSISGLYTNLWSENYGFSCRLIRYNSAAGDVVPQLAKPNNDLIPIYNMNPGAGTVVKDITALWQNFWKVINGSNKIINGTPIPEGDEGKPYKEVVAEANFMRALSYFYLVRIFGDVPKVTNTEESTNTNAPRISVADIYRDIILPDLEVACRELPEKSRTGSSDTPSQWAAKALLTDVYMTMAGWPLKKGQEYYTKAAQTAQDIIEHSGLYLTPKYADLWKEDKKTEANEHMFALHNKVGINPSQYGKSFFPSDYYPAGWGDYFASSDFMAVYPNDDRKACTFETEWYTDKEHTKLISWENSANKLPLIKKYRDYDEVAKNGTISQLSNGLTTVYRYADVLLMYAEASTLATNSVNDLAKKCLKEVQERAHVPANLITNTTNPQEFDKAIFTERGWELYVEGKRWFDIIRREKAAEIRPDVFSNSFYKANSHYYLPIPMTEVEMAGWTNNAGY